MAKYRRKATVQAVQYDGCEESCGKIIGLLSKIRKIDFVNSGLNNGQLVVCCIGDADVGLWPGEWIVCDSDQVWVDPAAVFADNFEPISVKKPECTITVDVDASAIDAAIEKLNALTAAAKKASNILASMPVAGIAINPVIKTADPEQLKKAISDQIKDMSNRQPSSGWDTK